MGALDNKTILFSGVFEGYEREELEEMAKDEGAKILSGVSKNLNYLVAGEKMGPQKKEKASELGVPIISLEDFLGMLDGSAEGEEMDEEELEERLNAFLGKNYEGFSDDGRFAYKGSDFQAVFNDDGLHISISLAEFLAYETEEINALYDAMEKLNSSLDKSLRAKVAESDAYIYVQAIADPDNYSDSLVKKMIDDIITVRDLSAVKDLVDEYGEEE